jgi:hypothetical protein
VIEWQLVRAWLAARVAEVRRNEDRGDIVQTVIIVAAFAAAAIVIVSILVAKATSTANSVRTQ